MTTPKSEKLLVISEIGIGDGLTMLPALKLLKQIHPNIQIEMLAPGLFFLAKNISTLVKLLDQNDVGGPQTSERLQWLQNQGYRWVWNTENERSQWRPVLKQANNPQWICSPPHRSWPKQQVLLLRLIQLKYLFPDLQGDLRMDLSLTPEQMAQKNSFRKDYPKSHFLIAIQPGAKDSTKKWPKEKFRALSSLLAERGDLHILFFLGPPDLPDYPENFLPNKENIEVINEPLDQLLPKLAACDVFLGNDSGFYHLAYALGLKVIGIYRSRRNLKIWSYQSERSRAIYFYLPSQIRRHWHKFISVDRILNAINGFVD